MNKAKVTFTGDVRTITVDFEHNIETETLDYRVAIDPPINEGEMMDLATILADKFLESLVAPEVAVIPDEANSDI